MAAPARMIARRAEIAFLFLGEMLLAPHIWPIIDALARLRLGMPIDLWVSTSAHEALIRDWLGPAHSNVRLRRAPGFHHLGDIAKGHNPPLPSKLPILARLAPRLLRARVVICAEQTSLWIPRILPFGPRFIFTVHGAGPLNYNPDGRLKCAYRVLVPSGLHTVEHLANGILAERIVETGYAKASFAPSLKRTDLFGNERPVLLYAPHWQRHRSSWWDWGREIVRLLAMQDRFNVILAPHQRLFERDPGARAVLEEVRALPHVHADDGSFAMVDGSYTAMADMYLGDSSSQIVEFLARPRPCVLLQSPGMAWRTADQGGYQRCGETVDRIDRLWSAIEDAAGRHADYRAFQEDFARQALGDTSAEAPLRAAREILASMAR